MGSEMCIRDRSAAGSAAAAASSATAADGHANRAEDAANSFDLTVTSSTLAPGAAATVTVTGDGPAYSLAFGVPQGPKGDKGDDGEISQAQLDAALDAKVTNHGGASGLWVGTTASLPSTGTAGAVSYTHLTLPTTPYV